jgi:hypothetical protein
VEYMRACSRPKCPAPMTPTRIMIERLGAAAGAGSDVSATEFENRDLFTSSAQLDHD